MTAVDMARKRAAFRLDERILNAIDEVAQSTGRSRNAWLEFHLLKTFQSTGVLSEDMQPLGETRGGDRTGTNKDEKADET